ncbi:MAG: hypothetical protein E3J71_03070 [Candidatus Stahlbacteria bacterium]|nr:MAG: hypothetical protein E3J71_03070 [Candidatus Stahlbacteria bacterium]
MHNSKKLILAVLAVILLLGATPAFAQLAGNWEGTGTGYCYPRNNFVIYPWQEWEGEIPLTQDVFTGEWRDSNLSHGTFEGEILWISTDVAVCNGEWTWYDPTGSDDPVYGGDFEMKFYVYERECTGTWTSIWPSPGLPGTMRGRKID